jgi:hypothetical protein
MTNYDVGYGRPPIHSRFKKGECQRNSMGRRGKRKPNEFANVIHDVLSEIVEYREGRRTKRASRQELLIRRIFDAAARGDVRSADALLKLRAHAETHKDTGPLIIHIINDPESDGEYRERWIEGEPTGR